MSEDNPFTRMKQAMYQAERQMIAADDAAQTMASLLQGRLRKVRYWHLKALKKELASFNARTGKWKDEP